MHEIKFAPSFILSITPSNSHKQTSSSLVLPSFRRPGGNVVNNNIDIDQTCCISLIQTMLNESQIKLCLLVIQTFWLQVDNSEFVNGTTRRRNRPSPMETVNFYWELGLTNFSRPSLLTWHQTVPCPERCSSSTSRTHSSPVVSECRLQNYRRMCAKFEWTKSEFLDKSSPDCGPLQRGLSKWTQTARFSTVTQAIQLWGSCCGLRSTAEIVSNGSALLLAAPEAEALSSSIIGRDFSSCISDLLSEHFLSLRRHHIGVPPHSVSLWNPLEIASLMQFRVASYIYPLP